MSKIIKTLTCILLFVTFYLSANAAGDKDLGVVLLPNLECKNMANNLTEKIKNKLPVHYLSNAIELDFHPHCTLIHIANQNESNQKEIVAQFNKFYQTHKGICIQLPIKEIAATGGNTKQGFKWFDIQFDASDALLKLRKEVISKFSPYNIGMLKRMNDDFENLTSKQKDEVKKYGVSITPYIPHITAWYINLPNQTKSTELYTIAQSLKKDLQYTKCYAEYIAIAELGRNGNAVNIVEQKRLCE